MPRRIELLSAAINDVESIRLQSPQLVLVTDILQNAYWQRAETLRRLGRYAEAADDWEHVLQFLGLDADLERHIHVQRALGPGAHGIPAAAVEELQQALPANVADAPQPSDGEDCYNAACVYSLASANEQDAEKRELDAARGRAITSIPCGWKVFRTPLQRPTSTRIPTWIRSAIARTFAYGLVNWKSKIPRGRRGGPVGWK